MMSSIVPRTDLRELDEESLIKWCVDHSLPKYRAGQILEWIYSKRIQSFSEMSNLPLELRRQLAEDFSLHIPELSQVQGSADTTQKFLFRLQDQQWIETVLIPASPGLYGDRSDRHTLCVSSQVGCAYGCRFCASGLEGFRRNLQAHEIISQLVEVERSSGKKINNMVFMGMGEPLANYTQVLKAIRILNAPWGIGLGARKMTLSTSGLAPQIQQLATEPIQIRLALSLHGARDEVRNKIMPVNKKYPLALLRQALLDYQKKRDRLITFEYILLEGVNDSMDEVPHLARLARECHAKVNLIPFNVVEETGFRRPSDAHCEQFRKALHRLGVTVTLRMEKGHDIDAACGQLRLRQVRKPQ